MDKKGYIMKNHIILTLMASVLLQANIVYVNQGNKNKEVDGSSWEKAYKNLNKALKSAKSGDDIWVAKGEYILKPTRLEGINVYGGFSATEVDLRQRKIVNNETKIFGRLALQNALVSCVTLLEEPEIRRVVEINFGEKNRGFKPNKKRIQEQRDKRERASRKWDKENPEERPLELEKEGSEKDYVSYEQNRSPKQKESRLERKREGSRQGPPRPQEILEKFDKNGDGKISKAEAPNKMKRDWVRLDANSDGFVEESEIKPPRRRNEGQRPDRR